MDKLLAGYLALYHERTMAVRSIGLLDVAPHSPKAMALIAAIDPVGFIGEADKLAWGLGLQEMVKTNNAEITRLIAWAKDGDGRAPEALTKCKQLLAEIEAANWHLERL